MEVQNSKIPYNILYGITTQGNLYLQVADKDFQILYQFLGTKTLSNPDEKVIMEESRALGIKFESFKLPPEKGSFIYHGGKMINKQGEIEEHQSFSKWGLNPRYTDLYLISYIPIDLAAKKEEPIPLDYKYIGPLGINGGGGGSVFGGIRDHSWED